MSECAGPTCTHPDCVAKRMKEAVGPTDKKVIVVKNDPLIATATLTKLLPLVEDGPKPLINNRHERRANAAKKRKRRK